MLPDNEQVLAELIPKILPRLGGGFDREVYDNGDGTVIKIGWHEANRKEWMVWTEAEGTAAASFLAPIRWISPDGVMLIQDKVDQVASELYPQSRVCPPETDSQERRKAVRVAMLAIGFASCDIHEGNWGLLNGKPVVCDYGSFYRS